VRVLVRVLVLVRMSVCLCVCLDYDMLFLKQARQEIRVPTERVSKVAKNKEYPPKGLF